MNTIASLCVLVSLAQAPLPFNKVKKPNATVTATAPATKVGSRDFGVTNDKTAIQLVAGTTNETRVYTEGQSLGLNVKASARSYIYVINENSNGEMFLLYPNEFVTENLVEADTLLQLPSPGSGVRYPAKAPFGEEKIHVVASLKPIEALEGVQIQKNGRGVTRVTDRTAKQFYAEREEMPDADYAMTTIDVTTVAAGGQAPRRNRYAVCIGISDFLHVNDLTISHLDAEHISNMLQTSCGVPASNIQLLQNSQATKAAIKQAILGLKDVSNPGDTLYIFFSCHGNTTSDIAPADEEDGIDEYIVPYDGTPERIETMILDDEFGVWMSQLSGRNICIMLDNCYSGGASKGSKILQTNKKALDPAGLRRSKDFFSGEIKKRSIYAKDLDQTDTVVLTASAADEPAWEMQPPQKFSVFTYYLIEAMNNRNADADGNGIVSAAELFQLYDLPIQEYCRTKHRADQHPKVFDNSGGKISLK